MTTMRELAQKATSDLWAEAYTAKDGRVEVVFSESYRTNTAFMDACTPKRILAYEDCVEALRKIRSGKIKEYEAATHGGEADSALAALDALEGP